MLFLLFVVEANYVYCNLPGLVTVRGFSHHDSDGNCLCFLDAFSGYQNEVFFLQPACLCHVQCLLRAINQVNSHLFHNGRFSSSNKQPAALVRHVSSKDQRLRNGLYVRHYDSLNANVKFPQAGCCGRNLYQSRQCFTSRCFWHIELNVKTSRNCVCTCGAYGRIKLRPGRFYRGDLKSICKLRNDGDIFDFRFSWIHLSKT